MERDRILVAVRYEDIPLVEAVLQGHFDYTIVHTVRSAEAAINDRTGLVVCGVHFDSGAMFDLLKTIKADPSRCNIPFFLVLRENTHHADSVIKGIRDAARLLGVDSFIDLGELKKVLSQDQLIEDLREKARQGFASQGSRTKDLDFNVELGTRKLLA